MPEASGENTSAQITRETKHVELGEGRGLDSFVVKPAEPATGPIAPVLAPAPPPETGTASPQASPDDGAS